MYLDSDRVRIVGFANRQGVSKLVNIHVVSFVIAGD